MQRGCDFTGCSKIRLDALYTKGTTLVGSLARTKSICALAAAKDLYVELRAALFNVFNHPNFSNPLLPGFGIDVFGNGHVSGNPHLGGGGPRSAQLAIHITF